MQDFFCPRCGRRMLDGKCDCQSRARRPGTTANSRPKTAAPSERSGKAMPGAAMPGSALTEEKIIPFESIKTPEQTVSGSNRKQEINITLVDAEKLREMEERERLKKEPWKAPGLSPLKRLSLRISNSVSKFTAFVDGLVNPEEE